MPMVGEGILRERMPGEPMQGELMQGELMEAESTEAESMRRQARRQRPVRGLALRLSSAAGQASQTLCVQPELRARHRGRRLVSNRGSRPV